MSQVAGAVVNSAPNPFGGFAPFPNSIMIPFMGYQSGVLGYDFGINFETGKRTVKSVPSDLFNRIRAGDETPINVVYDGQEYTIPTHQYFDFLRQKHMQKMLTNFRNALPEAQSVMNDIINESVKIELKKAERTPSAMVEIINALANATQNTAVDNLTEEQLVTWQQLLASFYGIPFSLISAWFNTAQPTTPTNPDEVTIFTTDVTYETCTAGTNDTTTVSYQGTLLQHQENLAQLKQASLDTNCNFNQHRAIVALYEPWIGATYGV